jgi:hypothetical protein
MMSRPEININGETREMTEEEYADFIQPPSIPPSDEPTE